MRAPLLLLLAALAAAPTRAAAREASAPAAAPATAAAPAGKIFLTQEEALALAFPDCAIERTTVYLTPEEVARARALAGKDVDTDRRVVHVYAARDKQGGLVGTAYFDAHRVRTLDEVLMFVVDPSARIRRLEMLAFGEPEEYVPRGKWYAQFVGKGLEDDLRIKGGIKGVTGATLTANATSAAARRTLAIHRVLREREAPRPAGR